MIEFFGEKSAWFWQMVEAIGVITSLVFIYRQVRLGRLAAMLDELSNLEKKWVNPATEHARLEVCENYLNDATRGNHTLDSSSNSVLVFFENLGLVVHMKILEEDVVWERLSFVIIPYWHILEPKIREMRAAAGDETFYDKFEKLMRSMEKVHRRCVKSSAVPSHAALCAFAKDEIESLRSKLLADNGNRAKLTRFENPSRAPSSHVVQVSASMDDKKTGT